MSRISINIDEFAHQSPIPTASRIGDIIASGFIRGTDPATGKLAPTLDEQCAHMFAHVARTLEAGGGTTADIIKLTIWMQTLDRRPINEQWVKLFPDAGSRPARQVVEAAMEPGVLIQCDILAVIQPR